MYLILNKENDYKKNRSKITALELAYKGITKLISNQEGNLTENMLLNIKSKQDLTYNSLETTRPLLKTALGNLSAPISLNETIDYLTLNPADLRPHELGFENYVDNELLTNIMKNEVGLSSFKKLLYDKINQAQNNFYNSRNEARTKASQKGVYVPTVYNLVDSKTLKINDLTVIDTNEQFEFEKMFYQLKYKFPKTSVFQESNDQISTGTINVNEPKIQVYVKSSVNLADSIVEDSIWCKHINSGVEAEIGKFKKGGTGALGKSNYGYSINNTVIYKYEWSRFIIITTEVTRIYTTTETLVATPAKITSAYMNSNF